MVEDLKNLGTRLILQSIMQHSPASVTTQFFSGIQNVLMTASTAPPLFLFHHLLFPFLDCSAFSHAGPIQRLTGNGQRMVQYAKIYIIKAGRAHSRENKEVTKSHPEGDDDIEFSID